MSLLIGLLVLNSLISIAMHLTSRSRLSLPVPAQLSDTVDLEQHRKTQAYQNDVLLFAVIEELFELAVICVFILSGGVSHLDLWAQGLSTSPVYQSLAFFGVIVLVKGALGLPLSIYSTFKIEAKHGFNRTTPATFIGDLIKGVLLGSLLGGLVLAAIVWFFSRFDSNGWWIAWAAVTGFQLVLSYLAPWLILPLFNKFEKLSDPGLRAAVERYSTEVKFPIKELYVMDSSKRSTKTNAFFTGFGKFRRLVLFDTLIQKHSEEEIVSVVAHEVGHFKCGHIPKTLGLSIATSIALFWALGALLKSPAVAEAVGASAPSIHIGLFSVMLFFGPLSRVLGIATHALSRKHEFEADAYSVATYKNAPALSAALKKLSRDNSSHLNPHPLKVILDYTHPPVTERIARMASIKTS